jgi:dinuclear metal center YbgI/SA1388 family protein
MELSEFLVSMERLAPLQLAEEWDNVGLLLAPSRPRAVERVLLTVDLTARVLAEALEFGVQAIVAYHPPIFSGLKRLVPDDPSGRLLLRVIENELAVYSPHTALDAVEGGVNDWLAAAFPFASKRAIVPRELPGASAPGAVGQGRLLELRAAIGLDEVVRRLKSHLGLDALRVAPSITEGPGSPISTVALCAGAGGSVVGGTAADLYVTGEMRHHDVLRAVQRGTHVVLSEHTHTERGCLPRLRDELARDGALEAIISRQDGDPLRLA